MVHEYLRRRYLIAVLLGAALLPVLEPLDLYCGFPVLAWSHSFAQFLIGLGFGADLKQITLGATAIAWAIIIGALFGVPLGLLVQSKVHRYWLVFVMAALCVNIASAFWSPYGLGILHLAWATPEYWLQLFGVLGFGVFASYCLKCLRRNHAAA
jgi:hypothetical protein